MAPSFFLGYAEASVRVKKRFLLTAIAFIFFRCGASS
jgi:hypothetical protein